MSDPYLAEIRMVGFNFAPTGWALCSGQLLSISQNTALFSLIGTYYGGNGTSNFALPNMQAAAPLNQGNGSGLTPRTLGEDGGNASITLTMQQMAAHNHGAGCFNGAGTSGSPSNAVWANDGKGRGAQLYATSAGTTPGTMNAAAIQVNGSSLPHNNLPPFLSVNFIICLSGIYPSRG